MDTGLSRRCREFDISPLPNYDSIVLGSSTYFSNVAWQVKKVIDESIVHCGGGKLKGKVAGIFTSAGTSRDGKDCLKMLEVALGFQRGMKVAEGILQVAVSAMEAFHFVLLPEGDLVLPRVLSTWLPHRVQMLFMPPFRRSREISMKSRICLFRFTFGMPQPL